MPTIAFFVAEWNENFGEIRLKGLKKQKQCNVFEGRSPQNVTVISGGCQIKVTSF